MPFYRGPAPDSPYFHEKNGLLMPYVPIILVQPPGAGTDVGPNGEMMFKRVTTWALLDTGSGSSLIDPEIVERLSLVSADTGTAQTVNATTVVRRYDVGVAFERDTIMVLRVAESSIAHMQNAGMILGLDWLNNKKLTLDGPKHKFTLSWQ